MLKRGEQFHSSELSAEGTCICASAAIKEGEEEMKKKKKKVEGKKKEKKEEERRKKELRIKERQKERRRTTATINKTPHFTRFYHKVAQELDEEEFVMKYF